MSRSGRTTNRCVPRNSEPGTTIPRESEARKAFFSAILRDSEFWIAPSPGFLANRKDLKSVFSGKLRNLYVSLVTDWSKWVMQTLVAFPVATSVVLHHSYGRLIVPPRSRGILATIQAFHTKKRAILIQRRVFLVQKGYFAPKKGLFCTKNRSFMYRRNRISSPELPCDWERYQKLSPTNPVVKYLFKTISARTQSSSQFRWLWTRVQAIFNQEQRLLYILKFLQMVKSH